MIRLGPHALEQCERKGFPPEALIAIARNPVERQPSTSQGKQHYCDRCPNPPAQQRLRGISGEWHLIVVYNPCCERIVTAFLADRPTPLRPDQIAAGVTSYVWTHPVYGFTVNITATTQDALDAQIAAATEAFLAGRAGRPARPAPKRPTPTGRPHNPNPKRPKSYYKKKKKKEQ